MPHPRFVPITSLVIAAALLGACSSDPDPNASESSTSSLATTTTLSVEEAATAYQEPGPFPVGITTLELPGGIKVEVWYPAVEGTTGTDAYDVRELVPRTVKDLLTADVPAIYTIEAGRDATAADGEFPLVLFSHGFSGLRQQSSFLTSHLASWGMIVAAPDHWSRDLNHVLDGVLGGAPVDANDSVDDLRLTRELIESENASSTSILSGHVDTSRVGAVGHSAGGGTVLGLAADEDIAGNVSLASGAGLRGGRDDVTTTTTTPLQLPKVPSLFVAGANDAVVPWQSATKPAFDAAPPPSRFWLIDKVGHNGFDDFCTFGGGKGIIGVAEASGLSGFLDSAPQFRTLGEDGCLPPNQPVEDTFPIVLHVVTAWLREVFAEDQSGVGLSDAVAGEYIVDVTVEERLDE